jgi:hypothetical protein
MKAFLARCRAIAAIFLVTMLVPIPCAMAHKTSFGYLRAYFEGDRVSGKLELAVRDFDFAFFDFAFGPAADSGSIDWNRLHRHEAEIASLLLDRISLGAPGTPCKLEPGPVEIDRPGEPFLILPFSGVCTELRGQLQVRYDLMFDVDPQHRAILDLRRDGESASGILSPETKVLQFDKGTRGLADTLLTFIYQGIYHIWIGYDHVLFLVALLLPAVLRRKDGGWLPVDDPVSAFWSTAEIVTAFTVAHSVTLSIAALGLVELPSRLVESAIAASIAVAAINNIYPIVTRHLWVVAFVFGLIHGFGFASVLSEFGLPPGQKLVALVSFNIGVEMGQITIVAAVLPVLFFFRHRLGYSRLVMPTGSVVISAIALVWLFERVTDVTIFAG